MIVIGWLGYTQLASRFFQTWEWKDPHVDEPHKQTEATWHSVIQRDVFEKVTSPSILLLVAFAIMAFISWCVKDWEEGHKKGNGPQIKLIFSPSCVGPHLIMKA